jgi:hypothetical protein
MNIFKVPRPDLEDRWWHRFFKVVLVLLTLTSVIGGISWANEIFRPFYAFSFQDKYDTYAGREKNWTEIRKTYDNKESIVFAYKLAGSFENNWLYVENLERSSGGTLGAYDTLENQGRFNDVKVKELQYDFKGKYYRWIFIIIFPVVCYLILIHAIYRPIAYIFVGRKKA